ncbi:MAG: CoA-binding protein [Armatimonadota bacterium]
MAEAIAVIGASNDPEKYGNRALHAWLGTSMTVYPVNPREAEVEGMAAYASVLDIPGEVHTATLYVPPGIGLSVADELIEKAVRAVYLNPGSGSPELRQKLEAAGIEVIEACSIIASRSYR